MGMKRYLAVVLSLVFCFGMIPAIVYGAEQFADNEKILFFGDSITHGSGYVYYIQDFYTTRYPERKIETVNVGCSGDSAKLARGRTKYEILGQNADRVFIMLGHNDIYRELYDGNTSAEKEAARQAKIDESVRYMDGILAEIAGEGLKITMIWPSPYDNTSEWGTYNQIGANDGLRKLAGEYSKLAAKYNADVIDFNTPMLEVNSRVNADNPQNSLINTDRIHPNTMGHMVMTYLFLKEQKVSGTVGRVIISGNSGNAKGENCTISNLSKEETALSFDYLPHSLPMPASEEYNAADVYVPLTEELNQEVISVRDLKKGLYQMKINDSELGLFTADELSAGVNIATRSENPNQAQAMRVYNKILDKQRYDAITRQCYLILGKLIDDGVDVENEDAVSAKLDEYVQKNWKPDAVALYRQYMDTAEKRKGEASDIVKEAYELSKPVSSKITVTRLDTAYADNFSGYTDGSVPDGWSCNQFNGTSKFAVADGAVTFENSDGTGTPSVSLDFAQALKDPFICQMDVFVDSDTKLGIQLNLLSGESVGPCLNMTHTAIIADQKELASEKSVIRNERVVNGGIEIGGWNTLTLKVNPQEQSYSVTFNRQAESKTVYYNMKAAQNITALKIASAGAATGALRKFKFDNIRVYSPRPAALNLNRIGPIRIIDGTTKLEADRLTGNRAYTASMEIENPDAEPITGVLLYAVYDGGRLTKVAHGSAFSVGQGTETVTLDIEPIPEVQNKTVKVFALRGLETLIPITEPAILE